MLKIRILKHMLKSFNGSFDAFLSKAFRYLREIDSVRLRFRKVIEWCTFCGLFLLFGFMHFRGFGARKRLL